jgi:hypothetical protein
MDVELVTGKRGTMCVIIRKDGQLVGIVSALDDTDVAREVAARLADDTPASIRDRCYSLVQSIGKASYPDVAGVADTWIDEAEVICKDAGWT